MKKINLAKFKRSEVLITGGLGFIGSNLAIALVNLGARVTIIDSMIPGLGGNLFNIAPIHKKVTINFSDIRDVNAMNYLVRGKNYIFHLAGQVDHVLSLTDPYPDIDINIKGTAVLMEACKHNNPSVRVVYSGTRGQYGRVVSLPVKETAQTQPLGIYEISRLTAEKIIQVYNDVHKIDSTMLRLTNVYGPRSQMLHSHYNVVNWFVRLSLDDGTIKVFGDGKIKRDFLFVDDCVEALLMSALSEDARGEILNVGMDRPTDFLNLVKILIKISKRGRWEFAPFSPERKVQEPGDFYSDVSKIRRVVGWKPKTKLSDGLTKTLDYYRKYKSHYW